MPYGEKQGIDDNYTKHTAMNMLLNVIYVTTEQQLLKKRCDNASIQQEPEPMGAFCEQNGRGHKHQR